MVSSILGCFEGVTTFIKAQPYFNLLCLRKIVLPDSNRHTRQNSSAEHNWSNTFDISRMSVLIYLEEFVSLLARCSWCWSWSSGPLWLLIEVLDELLEEDLMAPLIELPPPLKWYLLSSLVNSFRLEINKGCGQHKYKTVNLFFFAGIYWSTKSLKSTKSGHHFSSFTVKPANWCSFTPILNKYQIWPQVSKRCLEVWKVADKTLRWNVLFFFDEHAVLITVRILGASTYETRRAKTLLRYLWIWPMISHLEACFLFRTWTSFSASCAFWLRISTCFDFSASFRANKSVS